MDVTKKLIIRSETIETLFDYYQKEKLIVNRRYQRKLVWTIEEKEGFIDSISINYPVPLFLVAEISYKGDSVLEIIDGMQRLNAIMSFIEGEFSLNGYYFDLETIAGTKYLLDKGFLKQKTPKLDREKCKNIASYQLPLSVSTFKEEEVIDEIFKRINSNGKHLSSQELRQAGATNSFGKIVRVLSENVRGDVSHSERLTLNNMKQISINNKALAYGIDMGGIFWRKHNLITNENIRESRDEELVAHLLSAILIEPRPAATSSNLDKFYEENSLVEQKISRLGEDYIIKMFEAVFDEFRKVFEATRSSFYRVLFKQQTGYVNRTFQVFFLAFYDMLVKEQMKITNYIDLCKSLEGVGDKYFTENAEKYNLSGQREKGVEVAKGLMRKYFIKRNETDPALNNGVIKLENLLERSYTENTNYDFKVGFHRMDIACNFDDNCMEKVLKTLTAIANLAKDSIGYIIVGVADKKADSDFHEKYYKSKSIQYKNFYITGIQAEADKYKTHDEYRTKIENKIKHSKITPSKYIDQILRNMDYFKYYDRSILIFRIQNEGDAVKYGDCYYERQGTSTIPIPSDKERDLWKRIIG